MNRISRVIQIHMKQKLVWFYLPWIIMLSVFLINFLVSFIVKGEMLYAGGLATMYIHIFVSTLVGIVQVFPFSLGFSIRRTDFYSGTLLLILGISIFTSILLLLLSGIENWTDAWGNRMHFFHMPYLNDGLLLEQLAVYVIVLFTFALAGFMIGSIYLRYRGIVTFLFLAGFFILLSGVVVTVTALEWWGQVIDWIVGKTAFELSLWCIPVAFIMALWSYTLIRKSTV